MRADDSHAGRPQPLPLVQGDPAAELCLSEQAVCLCSGLRQAAWMIPESRGGDAGSAETTCCTVLIVVFVEAGRPVENTEKSP